MTSVGNTTTEGTEARFNNSVLSVSYVVKSSGFYRLCGIDLTTTDYTRLTQKSCGNLCNLVVPTTSYPSMY